jgi:hypothetical protein
VLLLLAGCGTRSIAPQTTLPPPLIDRLPVRVGIYYSKEFREYVHKETRSDVDYEVSLGAAHVQNLDWLLKAMFEEVVPVEDPTRVADIQPPLTMVLEPKFEEYAFLTPRDVAGEAFIVTIRYLLTVYDGSGGRVDTFGFTGYGREPSGSMGGAEPLKMATQRAMRDAGAKVAVEFTDEESVRLLLRSAIQAPEPPPAAANPPVEAPPVATDAPVEPKPDSGSGG